MTNRASSPEFDTLIAEMDHSLGVMEQAAAKPRQIVLDASHLPLTGAEATYLSCLDAADFDDTTLSPETAPHDNTTIYAAQRWITRAATDKKRAEYDDFALTEPDTMVDDMVAVLDSSNPWEVREGLVAAVIESLGPLEKRDFLVEVGQARQAIDGIGHWSDLHAIASALLR